MVRLLHAPNSVSIKRIRLAKHEGTCVYRWKMVSGWIAKCTSLRGQNGCVSADCSEQSNCYPTHVIQASFQADALEMQFNGIGVLTSVVIPSRAWLDPSG